MHQPRFGLPHVLAMLGLIPSGVANPSSETDSSVLSRVNCRLAVREIDADFPSGEVPVYGHRGAVARRCPGGHLLVRRGPIPRL